MAAIVTIGPEQAVGECPLLGSEPANGRAPLLPHHWIAITALVSLFAGRHLIYAQSGKSAHNPTKLEISVLSVGNLLHAPASLIVLQ